MFCSNLTEYCIKLLLNITLKYANVERKRHSKNIRVQFDKKSLILQGIINRI